MVPNGRCKLKKRKKTISLKSISSYIYNYSLHGNEIIRRPVFLKYKKCKLYFLSSFQSLDFFVNPIYDFKPHVLVVVVEVRLTKNAKLNIHFGLIHFMMLIIFL